MPTLKYAKAGYAEVCMGERVAVEGELLFWAGQASGNDGCRGNARPKRAKLPSETSTAIPIRPSGLLVAC
ncbi:hypothetical protein NPX13_g4228 [Xylaria arbuscula]|uniref:Uncharacterized protein n=1 Tax=Xylaria arbuscula TaxID=114810 RepID=A0A9W8NGF9_9PEZI|nr:hypothetical protein NPX13_g4228 [Xylaria arbuscula]